jgi:hypothetical protein
MNLHRPKLKTKVSRISCLNFRLNCSGIMYNKVKKSARFKSSKHNKILYCNKLRPLKSNRQTCRGKFKNSNNKKMSLYPLKRIKSTWKYTKKCSLQISYIKHRIYSEWKTKKSIKCKKYRKENQWLRTKRLKFHSRRKELPKRTKWLTNSHNKLEKSLQHCWIFTNSNDNSRQ